MSDEAKPFSELLDDYYYAVGDYIESETAYRRTRQKEKDDLQDALIARHDHLRAIKAELLAALEEIAAAHLGDCPAAMDPLSHRSAHIFHLRMLATQAVAKAKGE